MWMVESRRSSPMLFSRWNCIDRSAGIKPPAGGSGGKRPERAGKLDNEKARTTDDVPGSHKSRNWVAHRLVKNPKNPQPLNDSGNTEKVSLQRHDTTDNGNLPLLVPRSANWFLLLRQYLQRLSLFRLGLRRRDTGCGVESEVCGVHQL
jgi:hypothetical protein